MSIDISNTFEKCAPTPQFTQSNAPHSLLNCSFAVGLLRKKGRSSAGDFCYANRIDLMWKNQRFYTQQFNTNHPDSLPKQQELLIDFYSINDTRSPS